jgi:hypothetical protein
MADVGSAMRLPKLTLTIHKPADKIKESYYGATRTMAIKTTQTRAPIMGKMERMLTQ